MKSLKEFLDHIAKYDDQTALASIADNYNIKYSDLVSEIYNLSYFLSSNIQSGDRILLYKLTDINWVKSFFATILAGGIVVSIDNRLSENMVDDIIDLTNPKLVINSKKNVCKTIITAVEIETITNNKYAQITLPETKPESPCEIIFTSGTWAKPKGVTLSQTNLISNLIEIVNNVYKPDVRERFLSILPQAHIYEQTVGMFVPMYCGNTIYYLDQITPAKFRNALQLAKPNYIVAVPRVLDMIQNSMFKQAPKLLSPEIIKNISSFCLFLPYFMRKIIFKKVHKIWGSSLHTLIVGGAALDNNLDKFFQGTGLKILVGYGMSETSPLISASLNQNRKIGEIGLPLSNLKVKLNEQSEILVSGPSVFLGYWPNLNQKSTEYFNTQDIGEFTKNGNLILKGRTKNLIIYPSGDKIFAEDIEYLASKILETTQVCVVNVSGDENPKLNIIFTGTNVDKKQLGKVLLKKLPFFVHFDKYQEYSDEKLPTTHTLKLNRKLLKEWSQNQVS